MPELEAPPDRIVVGGCVAHLGMFAGSIAEPNVEDLQPYGRLARFRFKQWQHLAVIHPQLAVTLAVVDAGWTRLGWVQVIDRRDGTRVEHHRQSPLLDLHVARTLRNGDTWLRSRGLRIALHAQLDDALHEVTAIAPELDVELVCHATTTPLEVVLPLGRGRVMWSHKVPLPVSGRVRWRGETFELDRVHTTGIFDIHKAHYPHHTWWHWGTFAGRDLQGRRVAANLTRNVVPDPAFHENALWVDGALSLLPPPTFELSQEPWRMRGPEVDLRFDGQGERREDLSVGPIRSRFRQRYGTFAGTVAGHELQEAFGLAEDHDSRW